MITIEVVNNGFILSLSNGRREVFGSAEELFQGMFQKLTGCSKYFGESLFGEVKVNFDVTKRLELTEVKEQ